jgi:hypothetical protein
MARSKSQGRGESSLFLFGMLQSASTIAAESSKNANWSIGKQLAEGRRLNYPFGINLCVGLVVRDPTTTKDGYPMAVQI